jgi:hypothetical protein
MCLSDPYAPVMARTLISGLINLETRLNIEYFPVTYEPVRHPFHGVTSSVAGVGYDIARALMTLGHEVQLASIIGQAAVPKSFLFHSIFIWPRSQLKTLTNGCSAVPAPSHLFPSPPHDGVCLVKPPGTLAKNLCNIKSSLPVVCSTQKRDGRIEMRIALISITT